MNPRRNFAGPQLRVVPAAGGGWRVEDRAGVRTVCSTLSDAEAAAQRMLDDVGGGELLIYDPQLRLRTVKRSTGSANTSGDR